MKKDNTGFWVVIGIAVVGAAGYWAYNKYVKSKVDTIKSTTKFFGIF
jgi:hypothetical protein